jgi:hypothetical protein
MIVNLIMILWTACFLMIIHEMIHWIGLKYYGMDGELGIVWMYKTPNPCIRVNYPQNFIRSIELRKVMILPYYFGWMWYLPFVLFARPLTLFDVIIVTIMWVGTSLHDLKQAKHIHRWWKLNERVYPINAY